MIEVSSKEFYEKIGPLDVTLTVQGNHPYKTIFKFRYGKIVGFQDENGKYFLDNELQ